MKKLNFRMLVAILTCGLLTTACGVVENPIEREYNKNLVDDFWEMDGNEGDSAVVAALESIENVVDLKPFISVNIGQAYYFNYIQPVDHSDPSKGTFKQQVVVSFVAKDAHTILHTQGYSLVGDWDKNHNRMDSIRAPHFLWALSTDYGAKGFDLNCVQVEYRYHGFSLPQGDNDRFNYLSAWQQSQDLHAIVTDLKKALFTGDGKWLSTGVSKNGVTTAQYAFYDEMYGWNDIDVYVPFVAPITPQEWDLRVGTYMLTESSKDVQADLKKAYEKLVNDQEIAEATTAAYITKYEQRNSTKVPSDSMFLYTLGGVMDNLFKVQSYGDIATWKKFIPNEKSKTEDYVTFFMLDDDDARIYRKTLGARGPRGPLAWRRDPFQVQIGIDQGNMSDDYTWYLEGKLLSDSDKAYFKNIMEEAKKSKTIDLQVELLKNLETTNKKLIFVYGENDPWTGAAIPDPTNPNVKKYLVPNGTHTDNFEEYGWYPGGAEVAKQITEDVVKILTGENESESE